MNRDQAVQISRLISGVSSVGKRKKIVFNAFADFKPVQRFENRSSMTELGSFNNSLGRLPVNIIRYNYIYKRQQE